MKLILLLFFALQMAFVYALYVLNARLTHLENQKSVKPEPKASEKPQAKQIWEKPIEQPKAGTVAANAIRPKVFLSQTPHQAINLDNGGLEWEPKI
jgi:hypothetical protein